MCDIKWHIYTVTCGSNLKYFQTSQWFVLFTGVAFHVWWVKCSCVKEKGSMLTAYIESIISTLSLSVQWATTQSSQKLHYQPGMVRGCSATWTHTDSLMGPWGREAENCGSGPRVATGHRDSTAKRQPGNDRMGTVAMETQAAQANHGNW